MNHYSEETSYSFVKLPSHVDIGKYSSIADEVIFHDANDNHKCIQNRKCVYTTNWDQGGETSKIVIGNDVWIGRGARILTNVHIGDGAIIGAGAVIAKDVPAFAVTVGNPQQITRFRFEGDIIAKLLAIKWWDFSKEKIEIVKPFMQDIDVFLLKCEEYGL